MGLRRRSIHGNVWAAVMVVAVALACLMPTPALASSMSSSSSSSSSSDDIGSSIADVSQSFASYFDFMSSLGIADKIDTGGTANAGSLVGYVDPDASYSSKVPVGSVLTPAARGVTSIAADSYIASHASDSGTEGQVASYLGLGRTYSVLGLDQTTVSNGSLNGLSAWRAFSGFLLTVGYWVASVTNRIFVIILKVLQLLNPFGFIRSAGLANGYSQSVSPGGQANIDQMISEVKNNNISGSSAFDTIANFYSTLLGWFYYIGQNFTLPVIFGIGIIAYVLAKATQNQRGIFGRDRYATASSMLRRGILLTLFAFLILPCGGSLYTAALDGLASSLSSSGTSNASPLSDDANSPWANTTVASTLYDFQTAVYGKDDSVTQMPNLAGSTRYGTSLSVSYDVSNGTLTVDPKSYEGLREFVLASNGGLVSGGSVPGVSGNANNAAIIGMNTTSVTDDTAQGLISRYMAGDVLTQASYASSIRQRVSDSNQAMKLAAWIRAASDPTNLAKGLGMAQSHPENVEDGGVVKGGPIGIRTSDDQNQSFIDALNQYKEDHDISKLQQFVKTLIDGARGTDSMGDTTDSGKILVTTSDASTISLDGKSATVSIGPDDSGLTDLAMYNWLATDFSSSQARIWSTAKTSSTYTGVSHYAVTNVGGLSAYGMATMLNAVVLLGGMSIVSISYGLAILIGNLKRGFQACIDALPAMAGSVTYIMRWILMVLMMIIETFILVACYDIINMLFTFANQFLTGGRSIDGKSFSGLSGFLMGTLRMNPLLSQITCLLAATVIFIAIIHFALSLRGALVGAISEMLSQALTQLAQVQGGIGGDVVSSNLGQSIARGAITAAAMGGSATVKAAGVLGAGTLATSTAGLGLASAKDAGNVAVGSVEGAKADAEASSIEGEGRRTEGQAGTGTASAQGGSATAQTASYAAGTGQGVSAMGGQGASANAVGGKGADASATGGTASGASAAAMVAGSVAKGTTASAMSGQGTGADTRGASGSKAAASATSATGGAATLTSAAYAAGGQGMGTGTGVGYGQGTGAAMRGASGTSTASSATSAQGSAATLQSAAYAAGGQGQGQGTGYDQGMGYGYGQGTDTSRSVSGTVTPSSATSAAGNAATTQAAAYAAGGQGAGYGQGYGQGGQGQGTGYGQGGQGQGFGQGTGTGYGQGTAAGMRGVSGTSTASSATSAQGSAVTMQSAAYAAGGQGAGYGQGYGQGGQGTGYGQGTDMGTRGASGTSTASSATSVQGSAATLQSAAYAAGGQGQGQGTGYGQGMGYGYGQGTGTSRSVSGTVTPSSATSAAGNAATTQAAAYAAGGQGAGYGQGYGQGGQGQGTGYGKDGQGATVASATGSEAGLRSVHASVSTQGQASATGGAQGRAASAYAAGGQAGAAGQGGRGIAGAAGQSGTGRAGYGQGGRGQAGASGKATAQSPQLRSVQGTTQQGAGLSAAGAAGSRSSSAYAAAAGIGGMGQGGQGQGFGGQGVGKGLGGQGYGQGAAGLRAAMSAAGQGTAAGTSGAAGGRSSVAYASAGRGIDSTRSGLAGTAGSRSSSAYASAAGIGGMGRGGQGMGQGFGGMGRGGQGMGQGFGGMGRGGQGQGTDARKASEHAATRHHGHDAAATFAAHVSDGPTRNVEAIGSELGSDVESPTRRA